MDSQVQMSKVVKGKSTFVSVVGGSGGAANQAPPPLPTSPPNIFLQWLFSKQKQVFQFF